MKRRIQTIIALALSTGMIPSAAWAIDPAAPTAPAAGDAPALVRQLGDDDFHVRQEAARQLRQLGKAAASALREGLGSPDPEIHAQSESLLQEIDRPPALPMPQPIGGPDSFINRVRISARNGMKVVDATESGRTIHIEQDRDGISMRVTGQIDGKQVTHGYKAKDVDQLRKDSPEACKLFEQYAGNNGANGLHINGGVVIHGGAGINIGGNAIGPVAVGPNGLLVQPGMIQPVNPGADNLDRLTGRIADQMKRANIPEAQQQEVNKLLTQLRLSQQPGIGPADLNARMDDYNRKCDELRKKLADLNLPDVGDALPPPASQRLGITTAEEAIPGDGLTILHVLPNSRAEKIGLKPQDAIQKINGKEVHTTQELRKAVTDNAKHLILEGARDGKPLKLEEKTE